MTRRDCPDCGTYLVLMGRKDCEPRWRCFGGSTHEYELGPDREFSPVPRQPGRAGTEQHRSRVAAAMERVAAERADGLARLAEL